MHYFKSPHSSLKLNTPESRTSDWSSSLLRSSALGLAFLAFAACSSSSSSSGGGGGGGGGGNGNQPPEFDANVSVSRSENSPINIALNATDPDNDPITFSIADTGDGQWFEIGPNGRSLRNKRILDFEMPLDENGDNDYSITVVVSDGRASTSQVFPVSIIDVPDRALSTTGIVAIIGANAGDDASHPLPIHDIDGDGQNDLLIGAPNADVTGRENAGIVYGVSSALLSSTESPIIDLGARTPLLEISGPVANANAGSLITSTIDDLDGDNLPELLINAPGFEVSNNIVGVTYLITSTRIADAIASDRRIDLADALGNGDGVQFRTNDRTSPLGEAVSIDDLSGDGLPELAFCSPLSAANRQTESGRAYVVFSEAIVDAITTTGTLNLSDAIGNGDGVRLDGENPYDRVCTSVAALGDVDNDGLSDLGIGAAFFGAPITGGTGRVYMIYGSALRDAANAAGVIDLSTLVADNRGMTYTGGTGFERTGTSLGAVGDYNNDGFDDFFISAEREATRDQSESYLIFGRSRPVNLSQRSIELADLNVTAQLLELRSPAQTTTPLADIVPAATTADLDGDGNLDPVFAVDLIDTASDARGAVYMIDAGQRMTRSGVVDLDNLSPSVPNNDGVLIIEAIDSNDVLTVGSALFPEGGTSSDINIVIGAQLGDGLSREDSGEVYVISNERINESREAGLIKLDEYLPVLTSEAASTN